MITFGELRVWNTVRTPAQIADNLDTIMQPQPGLLALYKFNEQSGAIAADSSGHKHDAALSGSYVWEALTVERPRLNWVHSGHNLILSWPAGIGFVLEATDDLGAANWMEVTDPPTEIINGQNTVTVSTQAGNRFFRLRK